MGIGIGYVNSSGSDIGVNLVEKSYIIDRYPELVGTFKQAGLWVWGNNINGTLGDNTITDKSSPVQTIAGGTNWKQVAGAWSGGKAGIKTDGTLWLWGGGANGVLGDNTNVNKSSPVQTIAQGTNWKQVAGRAQMSMAIKTDGTLWTWGENGNGQLGNNTLVNRSSPVQTIAGGTNWKYASVGSNFCATIKTDGTLWTWGFNSSGQLGDNTNIARSSPVQTIAGGINWKQVTGPGNFCAAIKTDGTLWTWGSNVFGQLGNNTRTDRSSPGQTIAQGTNWKVVGGLFSTVVAIKTDGTLWTWGTGELGELGNNNDNNRSSPGQTVATGTNWKDVCGKFGGASTSNDTVCATKTDGTLWTWGSNLNRELGNNSQIGARSSPGQTVAGGTNWRQIDMGMAIRDDSADIFGDYW